MARYLPVEDCLVLGSQPPVSGPRTLAIVLNWRQPQVTLDCVQALLELEDADLDILVIDNGSGDDSGKILRGSEDSFEFLELPENAGFAAGNNHGLQMALNRGYDFALMINNDAFAGPDLLKRLLAEADDDVGLLSPKIFYESEPERIWFAGGRRHPQTNDLIETGRGELDDPQRMRSRDVDYLLGACLLVNLQAARAVGLLDEAYFFYFEDLDWSVRFLEAGFRLRFVADAFVYHRVAMSTGGERDSAVRRYYLAYGSVLFWQRYAYLGNPPLIAIFRVLSAIKMVMRLTILGRWTVATAYLRGLRDGWKASRKGRSQTGLKQTS